MQGSLKDLIQICGVLTKNEQEVLLNYFSSSPKIGDKKERLLRILFADQQISAEKVCLKLYGEKKSSAFRKLKAGLKREILNVLFIREKSLTGNAPHRDAELECRKILMQGDMLLKRGAVESGIRMLNKARRLAIESELVIERIQIEDILRIYSGYQKGINEFESYSKSIAEQLELLVFINEAKEANYRILLPHSFQRNLGKRHVEYVKESYARLGDIYRKTKSPNIAYYYFLCGLYFFDLSQDTDMSFEYAQRFLKLILEEPAVYSETRLANAHLQIANILLMQGQYLNALPHAESAVTYFLEGRNNQLTALEILFYIQFRNEMLEQAAQTVKKAKSHPRFGASEKTVDKWLFMEAGLMFKHKEFERSLGHLQKMSVLLSDSSGWLIGFKILELMNLFEMKSEDLIEYRLETLRKLINRKRKIEMPRVKLIFQILLKYFKSGLDVKMLKIENQELTSAIELLSAQKGELAWHPMDYEIIPFHVWIRSISPK